MKDKDKIALKEMMRSTASVLFLLARGGKHSVQDGTYHDRCSKPVGFVCGGAGVAGNPVSTDRESGRYLDLAGKTVLLCGSRESDYPFAVNRLRPRCEYLL
jgi:hypothetical protein